MSDGRLRRAATRYRFVVDDGKRNHLLFGRGESGSTRRGLRRGLHPLLQLVALILRNTEPVS